MMESRVELFLYAHNTAGNLRKSGPFTLVESCHTYEVWFHFILMTYQNSFVLTSPPLSLRQREGKGSALHVYGMCTDLYR